MDRPAKSEVHQTGRQVLDRRVLPRGRDARGAALLGFVLLMLATIAACGVVEPDQADPVPEPRPPVVRIVEADGVESVADVLSTVAVGGMIELSAEALPWVTAVTFRWLDGRASHRVEQEPFAMTLDTTELAEGLHVIRVDLHERSGHVRMEVEFAIRVSNAEPSPDRAVPEPPAADSEVPDAPTPGSDMPDGPRTPEPVVPDSPAPDPEGPDPEGHDPVVPDPAAPCTQPLTWAPPVLDDPITVNVPVTGGVMRLDSHQDYHLVMPDGPVVNPLAINGGRNVVIIGGEIAIAWQGPDAVTEAKRRAFFIRNATGVVHIEGVLMHGEDIGEGIHISAPDAIVQIQNVRIWGIHARDAIGFTDGHPDLIQTWGNVGELRVDRLTGSSNYQGIFLKADFNGQHGPVDLRCVNVHGDPTSRYLFWMSDAGGAYPSVELHDVFVDYAPSRTMETAVWPDARHHSHAASIRLVDGRYEAAWPSLPVTGHVSAGSPAHGDFVPAHVAGVDYVSPGYAAARP